MIKEAMMRILCLFFSFIPSLIASLLAFFVSMIPCVCVGTITDALPGENWENPFVVSSLPFGHSHSTSGYQGDADASSVFCPYPSWAPDVFYELSPSSDVFVNIDLCGSSFDTKLFVLDADLNSVACDDDFYIDPFGPCGMYRSRLTHVFLPAGIFYIVVSSNSWVSGSYLLEVEEDVDFELDCPPEAIAEGEPPLVDGYIDLYNSGCDYQNSEPILQELVPDEFGSIYLCGLSGWRQVGSGFIRDSDSFQIQLGNYGHASVSVDSEHRVYLAQLLPLNCDSYSYTQVTIGGRNQPCTLDVSGSPGEYVWLWVAPLANRPHVPNETETFSYFLSVSSTPVTAGKRSWDEIKAFYR